MTKIISLSESNKEKEVPDNTQMQIIEELFFVPFGCTEGICGTCKIEVIEGMENLSEKSEQEKLMNLEENIRLACQCRINNGSVKIKHLVNHLHKVQAEQNN